MDQTERLLMDIATRMPDKGAVVAQLREIQKSLNTAVWILGAIALFAAIAAFR